MAAELRGYEIIARKLQSSGIGSIFGLAGEDVIKVIVAADAIGIDYYGARHENQAVMMADGYARATGRVGVAAVTGGPGFTNALTAINTVGRFGSKVVILVGAGQGAPAKQLSNVAICDAIGIRVYSPTNPREVLHSCSRALDEAAANCPSVLNLPADVLDAMWDDQVNEYLPTRADANRAPQIAVDQVADYLQTGWAVSRPVVLAGRGAVVSEAGGSLQQLAERIGGLLGTTLRAPALFQEDPFNLGFVGSYSTPVAIELLARSDCILAFGASLNKFTTYGGTLFPKAKVIQIDVDESAFGRYVPVEPELALLGDVKLTADALLDALDVRGHRSAGYRSASVARDIAQHNPRDDYLDRSAPGVVDPRSLALRVSESLPKNRVVVIDGAHNSAFWIPYLAVTGPSDFIQTSYAGGASSIGLSMGAAIGATVGRPEARVAAFMGDAGHMMSLTDLETAVRHKIPLIIFVSNDGALGAEVHFLDMMGMPSDLVKTGRPNLARVAVAMGCEGFSVSSMSELDRVCERLAHPVHGPIVVDCHIDPTVRADWLDLLYR